MKKKTSESKKHVVLAETVTLPLAMSIHPDNLVKLSVDGSTRIMVAVAENIEILKDGKKARYKMEAGRIAAQVAHVVSRLRMAYIMEHTRDHPGKARNLVSDLLHTPITTIVLGARDSQEIKHIADLAEINNLLFEVFWDDNEAVYGSRDLVMTAVAIGPLDRMSFRGVTDYLPLYKAPGEL